MQKTNHLVSFYCKTNYFVVLSTGEEEMGCTTQSEYKLEAVAQLAHPLTQFAVIFKNMFLNRNLNHKFLKCIIF